jgi:hypothetical protein
VKNLVDSWDSSPSPRPAQVMAELVSTYDRNERKRFLQFSTGFSRLPVGGKLLYNLSKLFLWCLYIMLPFKQCAN